MWDHVVEEAAQADQCTAYVRGQAWKCVLVKGVGKVEYDPVAHAGMQPVSAVTLSFVTKHSAFERSYLARDAEWQMFCTSAIRAGVDIRGGELERGVWLRVRFDAVLDRMGKPIIRVKKDGTEITIQAPVVIAKLTEPAFELELDETDGDDGELEPPAGVQPGPVVPAPAQSAGEIVIKVWAKEAAMSSLGDRTHVERVVATKVARARHIVGDIAPDRIAELITLAIAEAADAAQNDIPF
ncbi:MAG: hypothetical protein KatS3mg059_1791 [Thermomicrobiales bacterium]|nr:MAG: hypothetical protein KatS3mg059_1791 [Thermomicrobiales bacterium]